MPEKVIVLKRITLLLLLFSSLHFVSIAQKLSNIKITGTYSDKLDITFDIGTRYNVSFSYRWVDIHEFTYIGSFNDTPLDSVLNIFCDLFDLKYNVSEGFVNIEKNAAGQGDQKRNDYEYLDKDELSTKSYFGVPKILM